MEIQTGTDGKIVLVMKLSDLELVTDALMIAFIKTENFGYSILGNNLDRARKSWIPAEDGGNIAEHIV